MRRMRSMDPRGGPGRRVHAGEQFPFFGGVNIHKLLPTFGLGLVVCVLNGVDGGGRCSDPVGGNNAHRFVTVMTRNLDAGTDFGYIQAVPAGQLPLSEAVALTY